PEVRASASVGPLSHDIARLFGRPYVVDISKMPSWYAQSLKHYPELPAARVLLVKHPVRHVASFVKKKEEFSEYGDPASVLSELRTFYEQFDLVGAAGQAAPAASLSATGVDFIVRYEDFVASPEAALSPILAALGLSIHPRMQLWASAEHHHIGGNVGPRVQIANDVPALAVSVRKYRQRGIFLDNSYKEILTPADMELIEANADARWIAQRFDYDLPLSGSGALSDASNRPTGRPKPAPARVISLTAPFRHREGFTWSCELPEELSSEGDTPQHKYRSSWQLLEDGKPIGRSHAMHVEISDLGSGRHSHWGDTLYFSTSDTSDPNTNGRRYTLAKGLGPGNEQEDVAATPMSEPSTTARTDVASPKVEATKAASLDVDTFIPVRQQIERIRASIGEEQPVRALFDQAISHLDIEANEELIRRHGRTRGLSDPKKYLDCAFWILQKLRLAILIGLDWRPPQRVLDLGTGGGHFCFVCRLLGHEVVGVDVEVPMYREICDLMGVTPIFSKIERNKPLPSLGQFDYVTAFAAQFDHV